MNDQPGPQVTPVEPYIPHTTSLPEITVKAILLGVGLSILLAGANAYLGLLAGMTVSASIPAASRGCPRPQSCMGLRRCPRCFPAAIS